HSRCPQKIGHAVQFPRQAKNHRTYRCLKAISGRYFSKIIQTVQSLAQKNWTRRPISSPSQKASRLLRLERHFDRGFFKNNPNGCQDGEGPPECARVSARASNFGVSGSFAALRSFKPSHFLEGGPRAVSNVKTVRLTVAPSKPRCRSR